MDLSVAFITAVSSLSVAFIGLVTSILSQRKSARAQKEIEELKFKLSRNSFHDEIRSKHLIDNTKALQASIRVIQEIKDELQLIITSEDDSFESSLALERFTILREKVFLLYEKSIAILKDDDIKVFHRAKNQTRQLELLLNSRLKIGHYTSCLLKEDRAQLAKMRFELTDMQNVLRDARETNIFMLTNSDT